MSEVRDYPSRLTDPHSRKFETFSYLPRLTAEQIRKQVNYIVKQGWNPAIEHTEPEEASSSFWYMWKLPMFGETNVDQILSEAQLCHNSNPNHHVRIIGYDNLSQTQGMATVIYRAPGFE